MTACKIVMTLKPLWQSEVIGDQPYLSKISAHHRQEPHPEVGGWPGHDSIHGY
jgi:hypothetical protein